MSILDQLRWSLLQSKSRFLESFLVVMVIALGIGVIVTQLSLTVITTMQLQFPENQDQFRIIWVKMKGGPGIAKPPLTLVREDFEKNRWEFDLEQLEEFQSRLPQGMHAFVTSSMAVDISAVPDYGSEEAVAFPSPGTFSSARLTATTPEYAGFRGFIPERGSWFSPSDVHNQSRVLVLSSDLAKNLFNDDDPLGQQVLVSDENNRWEPLVYTVIGILEPALETSHAYTPFSAAIYVRGSNFLQTFYQISVGVDAEMSLDQALERVRGEAYLFWGDRVEVESSLERTLEAQDRDQHSLFLIGIFASIGLMISVISILNLMLARVLKRTQLVGLSMALGASRSMIFMQFITEALALGFVGSIFGVLLSLGISAIIGAAFGISMLGATGLQTSLGVFIGLVISLLFGTYPAYLGARIDPVNALRVD